MHNLSPIASLYKKHLWSLSLGILLAFITAIASISLLSLSGWFIAASSIAGMLAISAFNYLLPAAGVRGFSIIRTAGRWAERVVGHEATFKLLSSLRVFFFNKLIPLTPSNTINIRDADMLNRITSDVDAMDHLYLRLVSPLVVAFLGIISLSAFIAWFDLHLGLTLGAILLTLLFFLPIVFYRLGKPYGIALAEAKSHLRVKLLDWLQGYAELEIYGASERIRHQIALKEQYFLHTQQQMAKITAFAHSLLIVINGFTLVLLLYLAADGVGGKPADPMIALIAFATLSSFELLLPIAAAFQFLSNTAHSAKRLNVILSATPQVIFAEQPIEKTIHGEILIKNVSFQYPNSSKNVLNKIALSISAGEKVALLGSTGCGKSTLLQLMTRSWDPSRGEIYIDGIPLKNWNESALRSVISVVTQRVDLFNGTLRHNLQIANNDASDEILIATLKQVGLEQLIQEQGLDIWLGDGGRKLSGGERRRIGIARVILHDAPILLLDEPTEGLDSQTEQQILALLLEHSRNKTVLFITHRLIGLTQMDKICLMEEGKVIELGTHEELYAQNHVYRTWLQRELRPFPTS